MHRSVIRAKTVLVVAIVDSDLDRHRGIDQADHRRRYTDEVSVPAVCGTRKSELAGVSMELTPETDCKRDFWAECLDIISGNGELLPSNVSDESTTHDEDRLL